jgi:ceramide glucosyltransferase
MDRLESLMLCLVAASSGVYVTMVAAFLAGMVRRTSHSPETHSWKPPRVSILKPLAGCDEELAANLASFSALTYPDYEILFGVPSADDPAAHVVRSFLDEFPQIAARMLVTRADDAKNPKVAQLLSLERAATGAVLVVSDSNVRVAPGYLDQLVAELRKTNVALVSNLIAGSGEQSLGAALENLQLGALVAPGVVASYRVLKKTISVGKSMAMWRHRLVSIGGFGRVAHLLAEDHMLGRAFEDAGFATRVSFAPVHNRNVGCSLRRTFDRHTRWAKLRRSITPLTFTFEPLLSPVLVASLACLLAPTRASAMLLLLCMLLQTGGAFLTTRVLRGHALAPRWIPLEIVRCYLMAACWACACASRRVSWRGHQLVLGRDSAILAEPGASVPVAASTPFARFTPPHAGAHFGNFVVAQERQQ